MARKKQTKTSSILIKVVVVLVISLIVGVVSYIGVMSIVMNSDHFKIKVIKYDSSLNFINSRELEKLKGKNIFSVDLQKIQRKLNRRYPQIANLRIVREFPDRIAVNAKKRLPFAQMNFQKKIITIDNRAIILSTTTKRDERLPIIQGLKDYGQIIGPGRSLKGKDLEVALVILRSYFSQKGLRHYKILDIDIGNLSRINFKLSNGLEVYVDRDEIDKRMKILEFVLLEGNIDLNEVKYIDLRFKEPVIGKKKKKS